MRNKILTLIAKMIVNTSLKTAEDFERLLGYLIDSAMKLYLLIKSLMETFQIITLTQAKKKTLRK